MIETADPNRRKMSKLIEKLWQVSQATAQPLGFRVATAPKDQAMLLVASLPQVNAELAAEAAAAKADAVVMFPENLKAEAKALKQATQAMEGTPWGVWLVSATKDDIAHLGEMGCDFIAFSAHKASLSVLHEEGIGRVVQIGPSLEGGLIRAIDQLPMDAVLIGGGEENEPFLSVHHLMVCQRMASLVSKPLLMTMPPAVSDDDLQALWKVGIDGVVVPIEVGQPGERLLALREMINALPLAAKRQRGKVEALLPRIAEGVSIGEGEEEEEEEE